MADLYGTTATGTLVNVDANARKLVGDGSSGVGPYTRFGTPQLQAIKIVSATVNFSTSYSAANSNFEKVVLALQDYAEVYYVGIPGNTATGFTALVNVTKTDTGNGFGASTSFDGSYENMEDGLRAAIGTAEDDVTVTNVTLTGLTFA
jgi:hypothetical protein